MVRDGHHSVPGRVARDRPRQFSQGKAEWGASESERTGRFLEFWASVATCAAQELAVEDILCKVSR
jgi:hypothetical protein